MTTVYWGQFTYEAAKWRFYLAATDKGLCYIGSPNADFQEVETWVMKKINPATFEQNQNKLDVYLPELRDYLEGRTSVFSLPLHRFGTSFQQAVWEASEQIPYGETRTYAELAQQIGNPKAVRAVGTAIGANPLLMIVPCHRVLAKSGNLTGFRAGLDMKEYLLDLEKATS